MHPDFDPNLRSIDMKLLRPIIRASLLPTMALSFSAFALAQDSSSSSSSSSHSSPSLAYPIFGPMFSWDTVTNISLIHKWFLFHSPMAGISTVTESGNTFGLAPAIESKGYELTAGIDNSVAFWAHNYTGSQGCAGNNTLENLLHGGDGSSIDWYASHGVSFVYVNEICGAPLDIDPTGQSDSPVSIAYNVRGVHIIWSYIHSAAFAAAHPGVHMMIGLSNGDTGCTSANCNTYGGSIGQHMDYLAWAAAHPTACRDYLGNPDTNCNFEDFAEAEYFTGQFRPGQDYFADFKVQYPHVLPAYMIYGSAILCSADSSGTKPWIPNPQHSAAFWNMWDADSISGGPFTSGGSVNQTMGPWMDPLLTQHLAQFAQNDFSFCELPYAEIDDGQWPGPAVTADFSVNVWDRFWRNNSPYTIDTTRCQYEVLSGPAAMNYALDINGNTLGLGIAVTVPWTNRGCNTNTPTITVGANGNCNLVGEGTCILALRNYTTTGLIGNWSFWVYSVGSH
jgi:hypothetical protein